jgi:glycosyltransferase involved in cell wall biosynthesis
MLPSSPLIPDAKGSGARPYWSVMIPTYNPRADYLEETLRSVLAQDPGPDQMQIEVVDDGSTDNTVCEVIRRIGAGRVTFHAQSQNRGLANTWNRCIEQARGNLVHILHQDDIVLSGFYDHLRKGAEESDAGAIFCRHAWINAKGHWTSLSELHRETAGLLDDWHAGISANQFIQNAKGHWTSLSELHRETAGLFDDWHARITVNQFIQSPAIVVRRSVYEHVGGFRPQLNFTLDWEMWQRIAAQYSFWFEPSILACYRKHGTSASSRLKLQDNHVRDLRMTIDITTAYHPPRVGSVLARKARALWAGWVIANSQHLLVQGHPGAARRQVLEALRMSRSPTVLRQVASLLVLWARIAGARLKCRFRSILRRTPETQAKAQIESQSSTARERPSARCRCPGLGVID